MSFLNKLGRKQDESEIAERMDKGGVETEATRMAMAIPRAYYQSESSVFLSISKYHAV